MRLSINLNVAVLTSVISTNIVWSFVASLNQGQQSEALLHEKLLEKRFRDMEFRN